MNVFKQKIVTIWNPSGFPILPNLLRYETLAVADYGCMSHAPDKKIAGFRYAQLAYLRQTRESLNLGSILIEKNLNY